MKSKDSLLEHCEAVYRAKWQYVFGGKGQILSRDDIKELQNRYGKEMVWDSDLDKAGQICCDCSGLISSLTGIIRCSNDYFKTATEIKSINEREPSMKGWAVWKKGHIGVYDGEDGYYAMEGSKYDAVHNNLSSNCFTHIIKLCDIQY